MKSSFVSPECLGILKTISVFYMKILWDACSASGGIKLVNFVYFNEKIELDEQFGKSWFSINAKTGLAGVE